MTNKPLTKYLASESDEMQSIADKFTDLLGVETFIDLRQFDGFFHDNRYDVWFAEPVNGVEYLETNISYEAVRAAWSAAQFFYGAGRVAESKKVCDVCGIYRELYESQHRAFETMEVEGQIAPF